MFLGSNFLSCFYLKIKIESLRDIYEFEFFNSQTFPATHPQFFQA